MIVQRECARSSLEELVERSRATNTENGRLNGQVIGKQSHATIGIIDLLPHRGYKS